MLDSLLNFFQTQGLMPHGVCLSWKPSVMWLTVVSHAVISISYFIIPLALIFLIFKREDLKFKWVFILFGAFILLCGFSHIMALITLWNPIYGWQSIVLAATAMVSLLTAILVWPQIPILLKLPSPWQLEKKNQELQRVNQRLIEAENHARSILEAAPDAIIMIDSYGHITLANDQVNRLFGYQKNELIGEKIERLIPERYQASHINYRINYFVNPKRRPMGSTLDLYAINKEGKEFPVEISLSPMHNNEKTVGLAAIRDVSDKKRTEERLKYTEKLEQLNKALEAKSKALIRSNEDLDSFSYIASHDLREPLRGIHFLAQFLLEDYGKILDSEGKKMLEKLPRLSKKLDGILASLLDYSRIGRIEMEQSVVDMNNLVNDVIESLEGFILLKGVTIKTSDNLSEAVCDKISIAEVFRNLITNAIKYNNKKEKFVEIGFDEIKHAYYVKDNGIGIDKSNHEKIFQIFKRLHSHDHYEGSGAGLTIVKAIIERHGGKIWIDSVLDKGSCFYFNFNGGTDG